MTNIHQTSKYYPFAICMHLNYMNYQDQAYQNHSNWYYQ
ncbi:hypothetical protein J699_03123 [Acinetobacter sp. 1000160]|nr:hypothetical protein J522_3506 [Acinetobacter baumannii 146457]EYT16430.1 hypothetical protein J699_03123 [Acinetobacter sp. 1000160]